MGHVHRHGIQLCLIQEWLQQCTENSHKGNKLKTRCGRWKSPIISSLSLGYPALSYRIWPMQIEYWKTKSKGKYGWDISTDDHGQEGKIVRGLERKKETHEEIKWTHHLQTRHARLATVLRRRWKIRGEMNKHRPGVATIGFTRMKKTTKSPKAGKVYKRW